MRSEEKTSLEFASTGTPALDGILGGGIPTRSLVVIGGEPGSGKTVLTLQMLFHAARQGKKCLYFTTLSEPAVKVVRYMQLFDFFDLQLLDVALRLGDLGSAIRGGAAQLLGELQAQVEKIEPDFVAIDSFRAIGEALQGQNVRSFIYDLAVHMAGWGATTLLVGEYSRADFATFAEFAVADGILHLGSERHELTSVRELEVMKLRGAAYRPGRHFFDITRSGISVYPRVSAPLDTETQLSADPKDRAATGIQGLDELLRGGLPKGSTTLIEGGTGSGKTLLSLQVVMEGARLGERSVFFALEETPDQLRSIARGFGWDLAALEHQGLLVIRYTSPVELSSDRFLYQARQEVQRVGASRAVFDSLTTLELGVPSERRFKEMVYAISKYMRGLGATLLMTSESQQLLGSAQLSGHGVSFIADNVIQLRYVEIAGRLERAISVLKARGIEHDSELRTLTIDSSGPHVTAGRFKDMRGVLTGLPARDPRSRNEPE